MSDVLIRKDGRAGRITLNRPEALNAVTWTMIREIGAALDAWAQDDDVALVILDATGDRAFAAGGDIVDLYQSSRAGDVSYGRRFWAEEYNVNLQLSRYAKPIVSLMHGFTMGGGVGLSCHVSHRVVDESVQIAMPECAIGLIPDVGGSSLLARAPANFGVFLGLTGYRMGADDAIFAGFADTFVPRANWKDLVAALCATGDVAAIEEVKAQAPEGNLGIWPEIRRWFGGQTLPDILRDLDAVGAENADRWAKTLRKSSPLSLHCALATIRAADTLSLEDAFAQEYRFVWRAVEHSDLLEGIRAQVIDKDRQPKWRHARPADVTEAEVSAMLAPLGADELAFKSRMA